MLNSQSLSINQKIKLWKEHKEDKFKQIATDKCAMFNFFLNNNDIFHFIDDGDFDFYRYQAPYLVSTSLKSWTHRLTFSSDALSASFSSIGSFSIASFRESGSKSGG
jgi:CRISPR/Cas system CSM-associated protein Csm5 (group 7 of RAMP superfamily)